MRPMSHSRANSGGSRDAAVFEGIRTGEMHLSAGLGTAGLPVAGNERCPILYWRDGIRQCGATGDSGLKTRFFVHHAR
jgi:hypothetical protein